VIETREIPVIAGTGSSDRPTAWSEGHEGALAPLSEALGLTPVDRPARTQRPTPHRGVGRCRSRVLLIPDVANRHGCAHLGEGEKSNDAIRM